MTLWPDAQLSPRLARWIVQNFPDASAQPSRDLGLRDAEDGEIFDAGRAADAIIMTKDGDFAALLEQLGPPPRILWLICGNTSEAALQAILGKQLASALALFAAGEPLVIIGHP